MSRRGPEPGTRIELVRTTDLLTTVRRGTYGTVTLVGDTGTVYVDWDGAAVGPAMIPGVDVYRVLSDQPNT